MDFTLAFFIIGVSLIVFFIDEIAEYSKKFWNNYLLRHGLLMMFIGFFGLSYSPLFHYIFNSIIHHRNVVAALLSPYIPFFNDKMLIMFVLIHVAISIVCTAFFYLFYFLLKRKKYENSLSMLWVIWLVIGLLYVST